jgi:ATP-dependent Lon protease
VGGLKEKTLAALRARLGQVLVPEKNKKDLSEIPKKVRRRLRLVPVSHMDEILEMALVKKPWKKTAAGKSTKAAKSPAKRRGAAAGKKSTGK